MFIWFFQVAALERRLADAEDGAALGQLQVKKLKGEAEAAARRAEGVEAALRGSADKGTAELRKRVAELEQEVAFKQERVKHYRDKVCSKNKRF